MKTVAQIKNIPQKPGVYLFKDKKNVVLYIGKALNLKSRIKSYFQKSSELSPAKMAMVDKIAKIEYIITTSEIEALLLESNLIKKHQPPYNVDLKDDKYFLYIKITINEDYPRVFTVRKILKDKARYFGPFISARSVRQTLRLLHKLFPHRNFQKIPSPRHLEYLQSRYPELLGPANQSEYKKTIEKIIQFLQGNYEKNLKDLKKQMDLRSHALEYESAAKLRDKIQAIKNISQKQKIISTKFENEDIISMAKEQEIASVNLLTVRLGKLLDSKNFILKNTKDQSDTEIIQTFIERYYTQTMDIPKTIVIPEKIENQNSIEKWLKVKLHDLTAMASRKTRFRGAKPHTESPTAFDHSLPSLQRELSGVWVKIIVPQKGKKRQLIKMGEENASEYLKQQLASWQKKDVKAKNALDEFKKYLKLPEIPRRIEAFDISNIQGQNAVGSMVVFTDGQPDKKWYRKFKIKTVKSPNDPAMMAEVISRRLKHIKKDWPRPDLIILDGGKGQLGVALKRTKTKIPMIALAKQKEDIYLPKRKNQVNFPNGSEALYLIQRIRDEAHRFAITFYRKVHTKRIIE